MAQIQDAVGNPILANVIASGTPIALNDDVVLVLNGQSGAAFQIAGIGPETYSFEGTVDGTNWFTLSGTRTSDGLVATSTNADGIWSFVTAGLLQIRLRLSAGAPGTATVDGICGQGAGLPPFGGSVSVVGTPTVDTELPTAAALADATANPTTPLVGAALEVYNGATWDRMRGNTSGVQVQGPVAHDAPVGGNPVPLGAQARTSFLTAVANGDLVSLIADKLGRLLVSLGVPRELITQNSITLTTTTETTLIAAGGAGVFRDITAIIVSNTSGTGVRVDFRDATAGTVRFSLQIAANGGGGIFVPPRPVKQTTANNNWTAQLSAAVTDVRIFAQAEDNA